MGFCSVCKKKLDDKDLYCYTDDTSQVYMREIYYCKECYTKKYGNPYIGNQTYKQRCLEDLMYFKSKGEFNE
jgi:hypothetical protein